MGNDCALCGKPVVHRDVAVIMKLYRRCKQFHCLPKAGGVFDQDESMMSLLELIDGEIEKWRSKRMQDQEGELMKQRMLKGLPHG